MAGFVAHLRRNGFRVGPAETETALAVFDHVDGTDPARACTALKIALASRREDWERFDAQFEAFWFRRGRIRQRQPPPPPRRDSSRPALWDRPGAPTAGPAAAQAAGLQSTGTRATPARAADDGSGATATGRLVAAKRDSLARTDLRHLADPADLAAAERLAGRLARAMRYRLGRRYRAARRGLGTDLRRTLRRSLGHGGEPIDLVRRRRPPQPVRVVALLDVSGSMQPYSRVFLQFVRGLVAAWAQADAYLFHTRLVRITAALRDRDARRALDRLSLMAQGFGGGTRLADSLRSFNDRYARTAINGRTVVIILSDGYDTGRHGDSDAAADHMAREMARLRRRARRIVWVNPLLGWRDYQPVARAMAAALPSLDRFAAGHSLEALAALEPDLARL